LWNFIPSRAIIFVWPLKEQPIFLALIYVGQNSFNAQFCGSFIVLTWGNRMESRRAEYRKIS
jgi:hypothetical protein